MKKYTVINNLGDSLILSPLNAFTLEVEGNALTVHDGYHTMEELYAHRYHLYLALIKAFDSRITPLGCNVICWKAKLHDDGTMFDGDFILGMTVSQPSFIVGGDPNDFYITYHMPIRFWHMANVIELPKAPPYDGHTSEDVLKRLLRL